MTQARLKHLLQYDPSTGAFTRRVSVSQNAARGSVAGTTLRGYVIISVDHRKYRAHRLAWLYMHGVWPAGFIDHVNGIRDDNRLENLRLVNISENMQNQRKVRVDNIAGVMGVQWSKRKKAFVARIKIAGKCIYLGQFSDKESAADAYIKAKREVHTTCSI